VPELLERAPDAHADRCGADAEQLSRLAVVEFRDEAAEERDPVLDWQPVERGEQRGALLALDQLEPLGRVVGRRCKRGPLREPRMPRGAPACVPRFVGDDAKEPRPKGAPGRNVPSFRYALMKASWAASSPAFEPAMLAAVRRALSSCARTSSA
jgi:hypothetical protein